MQDLLLDAVEQRVLRQLDVQFAMMIAADQPCRDACRCPVE